MVVNKNSEEKTGSHSSGHPESGKSKNILDQISENPAANFSYGNLFISNLSKKKQIRKVMISEYVKEYKSLSTQELSQQEKATLMLEFKVCND